MYTYICINPPVTDQSSTMSIKNVYKLKEYYSYKVGYSEPRLCKQPLHLHFLALDLIHMPSITRYLPINPLPPSVPVPQVLVRGSNILSRRTLLYFL